MGEAELTVYINDGATAVGLNGIGQRTEMYCYQFSSWMKGGVGMRQLLFPLVRADLDLTWTG